MEKIAVIAGNKKQFDYFLETALPKDRFVYVSREQDIRGIRYIGIIKFGTYEDVKDYYDLIDLIIKSNNL